MRGHREGPPAASTDYHTCVCLHLGPSSPTQASRQRQLHRYPRKVPQSSARVADPQDQEQIKWFLFWDTMYKTHIIHLWNASRVGICGVAGLLYWLRSGFQTLLLGALCGGQQRGQAHCSPSSYPHFSQCSLPLFILQILFYIRFHFVEKVI